ncbi:MAG: formylglycine-generating enzyme family protein [Sandaracinaceae bacterium]
MARALALALAAGMGLPFWPQAVPPVRRVIARSASVVWISAGPAWVGADTVDVEYAVRLCESQLPLLVFSACNVRRFVTETPRRRVYLEAYGIDRTEVTQAAYAACNRAGRCPPSRLADVDPRLRGPDLPIASVTWDEAEAYCRYVGGRLPKDAEWERAASGGHDRRRFPWGQLYNGQLANHGRSPGGPDGSDGHALAAPVGSYPDGASPHGLLDMAGNVWEWTADPPPAEELPEGLDRSVYRVLRGGSWSHPPVALRVTHRYRLPRTVHRSDLGFRCAYDGGEPVRPSP